MIKKYILASLERRYVMDPRFIQWQNFRPVKRPVQPWNEANPTSGQNELVRPVQQPSKSNQQQTQRRGGCCGRRTAE
jgi:hypothetical protein